MSVGSFIWGSGSRRMTPEDITAERRIAAQLMQPDYSPVQSPWQGLARVAGNLVGGLDARRADRAASSNAADSASVLQALIGGSPGAVLPTGGATPADPAAAQAGRPAPPGAAPSIGTPASPSTAPTPGAPAINPAVMRAMTSPYVSDEVRALATMQYRSALEASNRRPNEPPEFIQMIQAGGTDPNSPEGRALVNRDIERRLDPIVNVPLPGGRVYMGPRSGLQAALGGGGAQAGTPPATLPPDFAFDDGTGTAPSATPDLDNWNRGGPTPSASGNFPW